MIVLDASVLIAHLDARDVHHEAATALLADVAGETLGASPITLAEVLVAPARVGRIGAAQRVLASLDVVSIPFPEDAHLRLAVLRAETGLKMPDCAVVLACEHAGPSPVALATFDQRLATVARRGGWQVLARDAVDRTDSSPPQGRS